MSRKVHVDIPLPNTTNLHRQKRAGQRSDLFRSLYVRACVKSKFKQLLNVDIVSSGATSIARTAPYSEKGLINSNIRYDGGLS